MELLELKQNMKQDRYDRQQVNRLDKLFAAKDRGYNKIGFGDFTKKNYGLYRRSTS